MLYLLDANTLISGDRDAYPLQRFPIFWEWLRHQGTAGNVKIPVEIFEEVTAGTGELVDWLRVDEHKDALLLQEDVNADLVATVTTQGYAADLNENEIELIGRDPFLIAYGLASPAQRTVVSFEASAPAKQRGNRRVPDVCNHFRVPCCNLYALIKTLDFTTGWQPPAT
jgi:hypothetical protein